MRGIAAISRRLGGCERGVAAIEFAFVGLIVIMMALGSVEFGRAFYLRNKLSHAVDLAARLILTKPDTGNDVLEAEILTAFGDDQEVPSVTITSGSTGSGTTLVSFKTVDASVTFTSLVPELIAGGIVLRVSRRVPLVP